MSNQPTNLLARMQKEADTWSAEKPDRALWIEATNEIKRLMAQCERHEKFITQLEERISSAKATLGIAGDTSK